MLALRSFQIFGAHWTAIARAYLAPLGLAIGVFGAAYLVLSVVAEASRQNLTLIAFVLGAIGGALIAPLVVTSLLLAVANALWEEVPFPASFSISIGLWPEQAKVVIPSFFASGVVLVIGQAVWVTTVVPAGKPVLETIGLILVVLCYAGSAVLAFLGTLAASFVAVEETAPAAAFVKAFDLLLVRNAGAGISAAVMYGVLLLGLPVLTESAIAWLAQAVNLPLLVLLNVVVPLVYSAIGVTFALLFAERDLLA
ncbi:MAG TPA: hypothetical protein VGP41_00360 [Candidatus Lustribacter sp.]|jgi:hypothetical protein|nr:hypothetical protein [Candidatus Lustribacter sp.]